LTTLSEMGLLPTRNFQRGVFEAAEQIGGVRLHDTILVDRETCAGCPIRCKRAVRTVFDGHEILPEYGGPEYETLAAFGSLCMNSDLASIAWANQLCNDYGLDTISAGVVIAFAMEASERGMIDETISWGDPRAIVQMVRDLAHREGLAAAAADGLSRWAERLGADFSMCIKGVEIPMHEPRGKQGMGLSYATTPRGANHMEGLHDTMLSSDAPCPELGIDHAYDRSSLEGKVLPVKTFEELRSFDNALVLCCFTARAVGDRYNYPALRTLVEAATGLSVDAEEMLRIGERGIAAMRLLSGQQGHTKEQDSLPDRFATALPAGPSDRPVDPAALRTAIDALYQARGYDRFGPTDATLRALQMEDCIGKLTRD
ncbi:MAG TPA: aldehyde ferredoxin oxidoreductase, partial [Candidatus Acetothermia bacterium]|nr:aldehyde ferredoxin oxidoreductase [Candidatus Acetothermia bacterium]